MLDGRKAAAVRMREHNAESGSNVKGVWVVLGSVCEEGYQFPQIMPGNRTSVLVIVPNGECFRCYRLEDSVDLQFTVKGVYWRLTIFSKVCHEADSPSLTFWLLHSLVFGSISPPTSLTTKGSSLPIPSIKL